VTDPYQRILELARREAVLVAEGRLEELAAVWAERDELTASLTQRPPQSAREALAEADRIVRATHDRVCQLLQELGEQIGQLSAGRRAVSGYGGAAPAPRALDARG
jgi:predicted TIM-barrel fold metal-dependent hydrolase